MTLAPAAGQGIGKMLFDVLLADPDFLPSLKAAAMDGLQAVRSFYNPGAKCVVSEPDTRTRIQALTLVLAQAEGEPIKRVIHQHLGAGGIDPLAALQESPALRDAARRLLEQAEWRTSGKQSYKRPRKANPPAVETVDVD